MKQKIKNNKKITTRAPAIGPSRKKSGKGSGGVTVRKAFNLKIGAPLVVILSIIGSIFVYQSFASSSTSTVVSWYRTCLNKEPDSAGLNYWSSRLDKGEPLWTVADAFMKAGGAPSCPYPNVPKLAAAPKPPVKKATVTSPAATAKTIPNLVNDSKAWVVLADAHIVNAKAANQFTYGISLNGTISSQNLNDIATKAGYVSGAIKQLEGGVGTVSSLYNKAISSTSTKSQGPAIISQLQTLQARISTVKTYNANIANDYKRAEKTYQTNLSFFGKLQDIKNEKQRCLANGWIFNSWTNDCTPPPTPPAPEVPPEAVIHGATGSGGGSGSGLKAGLPMYAKPDSWTCNTYAGTVEVITHGTYISCYYVEFSSRLGGARQELAPTTVACHGQYEPSPTHKSESGEWYGKNCKNKMSI